MNVEAERAGEPAIAVVIPCYDEAERLDVPAFSEFIVDRPQCHLIFVDDGSRDATRAVIDEIRAASPDRVSLVPLDVNQGKAAAVRAGVLHALAQNPDYIGYWDADLSTPLDAIADFSAKLDDDPDLWLVMGCRVQRLGAEVERSYSRHLLGRVFATLASVILRLGVYDTQCGAKLLRVGPQVSEVFGAPFTTDWVFDVELIARLAIAASGDPDVTVERRILELPLEIWLFEEGSKLRPHHMVGVLGDLARIHRRYGEQLREI